MTCQQGAGLPNSASSVVGLPFNLGDGTMAKYTFSLDTKDDVVQAGVVQSRSFTEALETLGQELVVKRGDRLRIGVAGFPPAHFECVSLMGGDVFWTPADQKAA